MIFVLIFLCVGCFDVVFAGDSTMEECISHICPLLFGKEDTVYVITDDDYTDVDINIDNPMMVVNVNKSFQTLRNAYLGHYIIYSKDEWSLEETLRKLQTFYESKVWVMPEYIENGSLVITKSENIPTIFKLLWKFLLFNSAVIGYRNNKNLTVYQSHPYFDDESECGKNVKILSSQCSTIKAARKYSKIITNYHECINATIDTVAEVTLGIGSKYLVETFDAYKGFISEGIKVKFKPYQRFFNEPTVVLYAYGMIALQHMEEGYSNGEPFACQKIVWVVPTPPVISPLKTIFTIFHIQVWIMLIFGIILIWISWALLAKYLKQNYTIEKYVAILMNVLSITLWGSTAAIPVHMVLRVLIVFSIFYSVVMQTAFSANLVHFLVVPQFETGINNVKDLAESKLDIFTEPYFKRFALANIEIMTNDTVLIKLESKTHITIEGDAMYRKLFSDIVTYKNCSLFTSLQAIDMLKQRFQEGVHYRVIENATYSMEMQYAYHSESSLYFLQSTDVIVKRIKESGINDKVQNEIKEKYFPKNHFDDDADVPLTMEHLLFVFTLLGFGLLCAMLVFLGEIVAGKVKESRK